MMKKALAIFAIGGLSVAQTSAADLSGHCVDITEAAGYDPVICDCIVDNADADVAAEILALASADDPVSAATQSVIDACIPAE
ncbi:MAG: hypothetical protein AAGC77_07615 [Pseudomonadota bacterium]